MFIKTLTLSNLLSFGPDGMPVQLDNLNVLIGPNGSGKSNFLEAISLLRAAPTDLSEPVKDVGGVAEWLWKGSQNPEARVDAVIENPEKPDMPLRHVIAFSRHGSRFEVTEERIENETPYPDYDEPFFFYRNIGGWPKLKELSQTNGLNTDVDRDPPPRDLPREKIRPEESILSQVRDPDRYPALSYLSDVYQRIRLYRDWSFGRYSDPRKPQSADADGLHLEDSGKNLSLVLDKLRRTRKSEVLEALQELSDAITDFDTGVDAGLMQLVIKEGTRNIPATRLSDGILRYLSVVTILLQPDPPPLVCIEEPEMGLHPDVIPYVAKMLIDASTRMQLIVTTHSDILIDALSDRPESVLVTDRTADGTVVSRLDGDDLREWLKEYRLGSLWLEGKIGATRW